MSDELILIQNLIYEVRGKRVMLDFDLARLYNVETRVLNQAVKRNIKRFPIDFMFQLTKDELDNMSSQFVMTSKRPSLIFTSPTAVIALNSIFLFHNNISPATLCNHSHRKDVWHAFQ